MWKWIMAMVALTAPLSGEIQVLAFAGSLRGDSFNKKLIAEAASMARQMQANVTLIDLKDYPIPFYDEDIEKREGMPQKANQLRQMMVKSDVILIASPEYNGSLSGVLKNTIDWASRSEEGSPSRDAFKGKKFAIMSASPGGGGGSRGLVHLRSILENIGGTVIPEQVIVPNAYSAFDSNGRLKDEKIKKELKDLVQAALN